MQRGRTLEPKELPTQKLQYTTAADTKQGLNVLPGISIYEANVDDSVTGKHKVLLSLNIFNIFD